MCVSGGGKVEQSGVYCYYVSGIQPTSMQVFRSKVRQKCIVKVLVRVFGIAQTRLYLDFFSISFWGSLSAMHTKEAQDLVVSVPLTCANLE